MTNQTERLLLQGGCDWVEIERSEKTGKIILRPYSEVVLPKYQDLDDVIDEFFGDDLLDSIDEYGIDVEAFFIFTKEVLRKNTVSNSKLLEFARDFRDYYVDYSESIVSFFEDYLSLSNNTPDGSEIQSEHPLLAYVDWDDAFKKYALEKLTTEFRVFSMGGYYYFFHEAEVKKYQSRY